MKQADFEERADARWARFAEDVARIERAEGNRGLPKRMPKGLDDFPEQYRAVCRDLALAEARRYSPRLLDRLNELALAGHRILYVRRGDALRQLVRFVAVDFPARVRREWRPVSIATVAFVLPGVLMFAAVLIQPELVYSVYSPAQVADAEMSFDPAADHFGENRDASSDVLMFGFYISNNIGIAFRCFAWGLAFGLGSIFFLVFNGIVIGATAAHMVNVGFHSTFFSFIVGHGAPELTAIVLSGAAGLRLGNALIAPGVRPRLEALRVAALDSIQIVYGVFLMLVLAAAIEAFWSAKAVVPPAMKYAVGAALWFVVIGYLVGVGRGRGPAEAAP